MYIIKNFKFSQGNKMFFYIINIAVLICIIETVTSTYAM